MVTSVVRFYDNNISNTVRAVDFQLNALFGYYVYFNAFQNSGSSQTVSGNITIQKMSEVYEGLSS